jgi:hypothetical protein
MDCAAVRQCGSVWQCERQFVAVRTVVCAQCMRQYAAAVCLVVYSSVRGSVRLSSSAVVCGSAAAACGSVRQCSCGSVWQCVAVRAAVCGSARSSVRQCAQQCAAVCGSVWQCARKCVAVVQEVSVVCRRAAPSQRQAGHPTANLTAEASVVSMSTAPC